MARKRVNIDGFQAAVADILAEYGERVASVAMVNAIHEVAQETASIVAEGAPVRTGAYRNSITAGYPERKQGKYSETVYADAPHHRVTHLLEKGHATRSGGHTAPIPHWENGERDLGERLVTKISEELSNL